MIYCHSRALRSMVQIIKHVKLCIRFVYKAEIATEGDTWGRLLVYYTMLYKESTVYTICVSDKEWPVISIHSSYMELARVYTISLAIFIMIEKRKPHCSVVIKWLIMIASL